MIKRMVVNGLGLEHFYEDLDGLILGHAEPVVELRGVLRALFGPLPELAGIAAREGHDVLLREVAVDGVAFHDQLVGRQGHGHVHHAEVPLHPCAAVEPQMALFQPFVVLHDFQRAQHGLHAGAVRAVGVGQVAGGVDLVGLDLAQQLDDDVDVLLREQSLLDAARFVERQVEEVGVGVGVQTERAYGGARFGAADGALQIEQRTRFGFALLLGGDDLLDLGVVIISKISCRNRE